MENRGLKSEEATPDLSCGWTPALPAETEHLRMGQESICPSAVLKLHLSFHRIGGQEWLWHSAPKSSTGTP